MKTCLTKFSLYESDMFIKAKRMKDCLDNKWRYVDYKHRCLKQTKKLNKYIANIQKYDNRYEYSVFNPVQFLMNKSILPNIQGSPDLTQHTNLQSMNDPLINVDVMESLTKIQITKRWKRHKENKRPLRLMSCPELHQSFTIKNVYGFAHMSVLSPTVSGLV